jgi:hypothetical protein
VNRAIAASASSFDRTGIDALLVAALVAVGSEEVDMLMIDPSVTCDVSLLALRMLQNLLGLPLLSNSSCPELGRTGL